METRTDLFFKTLFMLLLGAVGSLYYLSQNERCQKLVHEKIAIMLEREQGIHFAGTLSSLSFLTPSVSFANVTCTPVRNPHQWNVTAQEITFSLSMFRLLFSRSLNVTARAASVGLFSQVKNESVCFLEMIKKVLEKPATLPLKLDGFSCTEWHAELLDEDGHFKMALGGDLQVRRDTNGYTAEAIVLQGEGIHEGQKLVSNLTGIIEAAVPRDSLPSCTVQLAGYLPSFFGEHEYCFLRGTWKGKTGHFSCKSEKGSFFCKTIEIALQEDGPHLVVEGDIALATCMQAVRFPYPYQVSGRCVGKVEGILGATLQGTLMMHNGQLAGWAVESVTSSFTITPTRSEGTLFYRQRAEEFSGTWSWDSADKQLAFEGVNATPFTLFGTHWYLPQGKTYLKGVFSSEGDGTVAYGFVCERAKTEERCASEGIVVCQNGTITTNGTLHLGRSFYKLQATASRANGPFSLTLCNAKKQEASPVVQVERQDTGVHTRIELAFLQQLLRDYAHIELVGDGTVLMTGVWRGSELKGTLDLVDAVIRRPGTYNFINGLHADFSCNIFKRFIALRNVRIALQRGAVESTCIQCGYDPLLKGMWVHLPLTFSNCFINWQKDLYALFSGACVGKKVPGEELSIDGFIVLDKAQLKENIFSQKTQELLQNSFGSPSNEQKIAACIAVTTRSPIAVKTSQLETEAALSLTISTGDEQHEIDGTITLQGGAIHFPAHSLSILKGKLIFVPGHSQDPFMELIAQARIKKYLVTLSVGGTGQDPHLIFDSVPALSEEQIMMLLLSGSEEESFNIAAPALIMRNIEKIVFGSSYRSRHDTWLEPLKRIRFVPRFTDQTGRGGFKGALEIEVSKKLRAMIEKNFSLTEDVAYEVEYLLTDDISLRASCDERGDLGAEVEMRFKF